MIDEIELPQPIPELMVATVLVAGSGRRLRDIKDEPTANFACVVINEGGKTGKFFTSYDCRFERVTSEFNSHLAVRYNQICASGTNSHAVIHA